MGPVVQVEKAMIQHSRCYTIRLAKALNDLGDLYNMQHTTILMQALISASSVLISSCQLQAYTKLHERSEANHVPEQDLHVAISSEQEVWMMLLFLSNGH